MLGVVLIGAGALLAWFAFSGIGQPTPGTSSTPADDSGSGGGGGATGAVATVAKAAGIVGTLAKVGTSLFSVAKGTIASLTGAGTAAAAGAAGVGAIETTSGALTVAAPEILRNSLFAGAAVTAEGSAAAGAAGAAAAGTSGGAAAAGGTTAATPATIGGLGVAGSIGAFFAPVLIAFAALSIAKMISDKEQAKNRSRRAGDANNFLASIIQKLERIPAEGYGVFGELAMTGTGVTVGGAIHSAALQMHNHGSMRHQITYLGRQWQRHWSAIATMLEKLGHPPQNNIALRDVNSVTEAIFVTGADGPNDMIARFGGWKSIMAFLNDAFTVSHGDEYIAIRSAVKEPYLPKPPAPIAGYGTVDAFWLQYFGWLNRTGSVAEATRMAMNVMGYYEQPFGSENFVAAEPFVPQLF